MESGRRLRLDIDDTAAAGGRAGMQVKSHLRPPVMRPKAAWPPAFTTLKGGIYGTI